MLAVAGVDRVGRVSVGNEDVVLLDQELDIGQQPPVNPLAGESRNRDELASARRLAQLGVDLGARHLAERGSGERAGGQHGHEHDYDYGSPPRRTHPLPVASTLLRDP